jgi:hypothetical protein
MGIEEAQKVWRLNDYGHDTRVVSKKKRSCGREDRQDNVEDEAHVAMKELSSSKSAQKSKCVYKKMGSKGRRHIK